MFMAKSMKTKKTNNRIPLGLKHSLGIAALAAAFLSPAFLFGQAGGYSQPAPPQSEGQAEGTDARQVQQKLAQVQQELQKINNEVNSVRMEAAAQPEVENALLTYNETLTEVMIENAPEKSDAIEKRGDLFEKILSSRDADEADQQELQELNQEFLSLNQNLQPELSAAEQSEKVAEARTDYSEKLTEAMVSIDPDLQKKANRRNELMREFQALQQQIQG